MANTRGELTSTGNFWNRCTDATNKIFTTYSFWHKASDCEFDDGDNAEDKVGMLASDITSGTITFGDDGTITESLTNGMSIVTVFNDDGSITETYSKSGMSNVSITTSFNSDGSITRTRG